MNKLSNFLKSLWVIRVYKDGDGFGFVWRWLNPLTWLLAPVFILYAVLMQGVPETLANLHYVGIGINPWFIERPERLEWIP